MKKAYTITPEQYREKQREINKIGYKNGWYDQKTGRYTLSEGTNPRTRKHFENLTKACNEMPKPKDKRFFMDTDIYNLWLNRHTDEPITARELYNIVTAIFGEIGDAENRASYEWDGQSTIM